MHTGVTGWRKSTRSGSGGNDNNCVEVRRSTNADFHLRDSKLKSGSPVFALSADDFAALAKTL